MLAEGFVTGEESAAAPEGFAKRATDHGDVAHPEPQSPPSVTEHAEGVRFVQQQLWLHAVDTARTAQPEQDWFPPC